MSTDEFFNKKRPWSRIKDAILGSYMSPYFAKLATRKEKILVIDAFAGPGKFGNNQPGSPLIICQAAQKYAPNNYEAIFINLDADYHLQLESILLAGGYKNAKAIHGDSKDILQRIHSRLDEPLTIFLYMDPFGVKDVNFDLIRPFIERNPKYSTEILINLQNPILHRMAARDKFLENPESDAILTFHRSLSRILGGDYWKQPMIFDEFLSPKERIEKVVRGYRDLLSSTNYLIHTGACPIQDSVDSEIKYHMIFASRHIDATKLFNENMIKAFQQYMSEKEFSGTLFSDMSWRDWRDLGELKKITLNYVKSYQGKTRMALWEIIVTDYFFRFSYAEYREAVNELIDEGKIYSPTPKPTKRLNDNCELYPVKGS